MRSSVVQAACCLHAAGDDARAPRSSCATPPSGSRAEIRAALAQMAIDIGRPADRHPHRQGRGGARAWCCRASTIRCTRSPSSDWPVPTEFALAIARQESELDPAAVSTAGARGLMQLMPATAKAIAGDVGRRATTPAG